MNRKAPRYDSDADRAIAALIEETDWEDMVKRLLLYVLHRLTRHGLTAGRHAKAKSHVERAVAELLDNQHELTLVTHTTLFGCLCVIADVLIRDDAEEARKRAQWSTSTENARRVSLITKGRRKS